MPATEELPEQSLPVSIVATESSVFLAEASRQLSGCSDLRHTLRNALRVVVPRLAGWAQLALFEPHAVTLTAGNGAATEHPRTATVALPLAAHTGLGLLRRHARPERCVLPAGADADTALRALLPDDTLRAAALARRPVEAIGIPLVAADRTLGALVLVRSGEPLTDADFTLAEDVAGRIAVAIDVARMYEERAQLAAALRSSLRPPSLPEIEGVDLAARYVATAEHIELGGDFFDVHGAGDDWIATIGDVCGRGAEAAILTGRSRQTLRTAARLDHSPGTLLGVLNEALYEPDGDRFVTAVCARLRVDRHPPGLTVDVASAGHPAPLLLRADGGLEQLDVRGPLCGVLPETSHEPCRVHLAPGDTLLLFTDGICAARGPADCYGMSRLAELLPGLAGEHPEVVCAAVETSVLTHLAGGPHDDLALLAVRCGAASRT